MQTPPERLDALATLTLAGQEGRIALITRMVGAIVQPDLAGHDDGALLAGDGLAVAPISVGRACGSPDAGTLEVIVPDGGGVSLHDEVDVRLETTDGLWSGVATIVAGRPAEQPDHRRLTLELAGPLTARARRSQFRYALPEGVSVAAVLWPMAEPASTHHHDDPPFEPRAIAPLAMPGRMVEIGGGGLGAVFPSSGLRWTEWFDRFMVGVGAPGDPARATLQTTVRIASRRVVPPADRTPGATEPEERLGLEFEVARQARGSQHAYVYVEVMKLIESIQGAALRAA